MPCPATMQRRWKRDATAISPNRSARASFSPKCANSWGDAEGSRRLRTPPRILVADDNPTNLEVLRVRLNAHGYEIVTAVDGTSKFVGLDRKSTRLNSSHVKISYAVFCLKKKKNNNKKKKKIK